jgi:hypothetical protein
MPESREYSDFQPSIGLLRAAEQGQQAGERPAGQRFAVIRRYDGVDPRSIDEVTRRVNEGLVPIISQIPGFVAYCALDGGGGVVASVSIFESQAGADESTRRVASWVKANLASLVPNPPQFTSGTVIAFTVKQD